MSWRDVLNDRVKAVIENEWGQLLSNRVVLFTTLGPPILLVVLSLSALFMSSWLESDISPSDMVRFQNSGNEGLYNALKEAQELQRDLRFALLSSFLILFQMIPMVVPLSIASHSIVAEKQNRSLEPLLATPVRTSELLIGKALAAAIPGVLATWYGFAFFAFGARFAVSDFVYRRLIIGPTWILCIVLLAPLFTMLTVGLSMIISSRVKDANSAQQLGSLVILPLVGVMIVQMVGVISYNIWLVLATSLLIAIVDLYVLRVSVRVFKREEILTTSR